MQILIAEDDRAVRESLVRALRLEGYEVEAVTNGADALVAVAERHPDLLLLDVSMPNVDGLTVTRVLRAEGDRSPILMLTARTGTHDRVAGLDAGADDYLAKPFDLDELLARVRALLRRSSFADPGRDPVEQLQLDDLVVVPAARTAHRGGHELELSRTEFDLLELFVRNAGIVLAHTTIYERIWQYDFGPESKNLAVYVGYLRRKTEQFGGGRLVHTVRGVGYVARVGAP